MTDSPVRAPTVVLVDDHPVFRHGLAALLGEDGIEVVAHAATAAEACAAAAQHRPDIVIMDLHLPDGSGVEATRQILLAQPGIRVLVLTMDSGDAAALAALRAGVRGYLLKETAAESMGAAVSALMRGQLVLDGRLADRLPALLSRQSYDVPGVSGLSSRELEVLTLVSQGLANAEIGAKLFLAEKTIRNNITALLAKTGQTSRAALIAYARDHDL
jgi:DNA-binding NarL/FixJ family response regulator